MFRSALSYPFMSTIQINSSPFPLLGSTYNCCFHCCLLRQKVLCFYALSSGSGSSSFMERENFKEFWPFQNDSIYSICDSCPYPRVDKFSPYSLIYLRGNEVLFFSIINQNPLFYSKKNPSEMFSLSLQCAYFSLPLTRVCSPLLQYYFVSSLCLSTGKRACECKFYFYLHFWCSNALGYLCLTFPIFKGMGRGENSTLLFMWHSLIQILVFPIHPER